MGVVQPVSCQAEGGGSPTGAELVARRDDLAAGDLGAGAAPQSEGEVLVGWPAAQGEATPGDGGEGHGGVGPFG